MLLVPSRGFAADAKTQTLTQTPYAQVVPGRPLRFPHDEGSHPEFRTEWWYVTGWLTPNSRTAVGFQITFFRTRPTIDERNPSAFTAHQIMIAHAALSDARRGRLLHDQRVQRAALGLAGADVGRTRVWIDDWSIVQNGSSYRARIAAGEFGLDLELRPTQPPLLQGEQGLSRKGPHPRSASYYYSIPHLAVHGSVIDSGRTSSAAGSAWLDHEWSSSYMDGGAVGWDWVGINLDDGGALMAFRMRKPDGESLWAGGSYRDRAGTRRVFSPEDIVLVPLRLWQSPRTGATYPVAWRVSVGTLTVTFEPLMDDQESDTRATVGTVYWEGAVRAVQDGKPIGRGYLELTGYLQPLRL
jgi:predicted secreted hydrolase